jgi:NADH-quinone oxidoreductase subunit L
VDGLVNLAGWIGKVFGFLQGWIDRWFVDGAVNLVGDAIVRSGRSLRRVQSGRIQSYIYGLVLGSVTLVVVVYVVPW